MTSSVSVSTYSLAPISGSPMFNSEPNFHLMSLCDVTWQVFLSLHNGTCLQRTAK